MTTPNQTPTDLAAGTLSDQDRETFLRARGMKPDLPEEEQQRIRAQWPDSEILEAIGSGLF